MMEVETEEPQSDGGEHTPYMNRSEDDTTDDEEAGIITPIRETTAAIDDSSDDSDDDEEHIEQEDPLEVSLFLFFLLHSFLEFAIVPLCSIVQIMSRSFENTPPMVVQLNRHVSHSAFLFFSNQ
jgi:hypothetical protein